MTCATSPAYRKEKTGHQQYKCGIQFVGTNHDGGIRHCGEDVELALEDKREDRENAAEKIDGHEEERYAEDASNLRIPLNWGLSAGRHNMEGEKNDGHGQV